MRGRNDRNDTHAVEYLTETKAKLELDALFCLEPLPEASQVDDHPLMRAVADFLDLVARGHVEFDAAAVDLGDDGFGRHAVADRRCGEMADIHGRTDCAFAWVEVVPHCIERGIFHRGHHHWRGEHGWQRGVLELVCQMCRYNAQRIRSFGSNGDCAHRISVLCGGYD